MLRKWLLDTGYWIFKPIFIAAAVNTQYQISTILLCRLWRLFQGPFTFFVYVIEPAIFVFDRA